MSNIKTNTAIFFLMTEKGYKVLRDALDHKENNIEAVICSRDDSLEKDFYIEIQNLCLSYGIGFYDKSATKEIAQLKSNICIAVSWRWLIKDPSKKIIVLHDSLLPRYRGFAPLINSLINKEKYIGVTALLANEGYDCGPIIYQLSAEISYPIKINDAIEIISNLYVEVVRFVMKILNSNKEFVMRDQDEEQATYSLWRDEQDFYLDWSLDAQIILRTIHALGYPYSGARTIYEGNALNVMDAEIVEDVRIMNRVAGKIFRLENGNPIVICGQGLIKLTKLTLSSNKDNVVKITKLRGRFK